jgi:hypothetical protein
VLEPAPAPTQRLGAPVAAYAVNMPDRASGTCIDQAMATTRLLPACLARRHAEPTLERNAISSEIAFANVAKPRPRPFWPAVVQPDLAGKAR